MVVTRAGKGDSRDTLIYGDIRFNRTDCMQFKYLGTHVTLTKNIRVKWRNRLRVGNSYYQTPYTDHNTKIRIYGVIVVPALLSYEAKFRVFKNRKDQYMTVKVSRTSMTQQRNHDCYDYPGIIKTLESCRLRWLRQLTRIRKDQTTIAIITRRKRLVVRPRRRRVDNVYFYLHNFPLEGDWTMEAAVRVSWFGGGGLRLIYLPGTVTELLN